MTPVPRILWGSPDEAPADTIVVRHEDPEGPVPVDLPKNFKVSVDGVATIIANGQETTRKDGTTTTTGYGLNTSRTCASA